MQRNWVIEEIVPTPDGWIANPRARDQVEQLLIDAAAVVRLVGGTVAIVGVRAKIGTQDEHDIVPYQTHVRWESNFETRDFRVPDEDEGDQAPAPPEPEAPTDDVGPPADVEHLEPQPAPA